MGSPWVTQQLSNAIAIYLTSKQDYRVGNMPQLIIGTNIVGGNRTSNQLVYLMKMAFDINPSTPVVAPFNPLFPTNRAPLP